jgi:NAD(P)-dependent dehydrogenase (short-subunit alcohol dehydrogenase family)
MGRLDGRVAIVTGAGRGLGRAHALRLAAEGAAVVVNDRGSALDGSGVSMTPAEEVVEEIRRGGGRAVASGHDVGDWNDAAAMVDLAVKSFGDLHVLVNNAGIIRDRTLANMSEEEWDLVIRVHLKGHAATSRHAMAYWRERSKKTGQPVKASVVHTSSLAGIAGNFGQANYSAAKLGVVAMSRVIALEGARMGVRSNAVSPSARTRFTEGMGPPPVPGTFDARDPGNVSPLIAWLAEADCPANAQLFQVYGSRLLVFSMPQIVHDLKTDGRWTPEALDQALAGKLVNHATVEELLAMLRPAVGSD